MERPRKRRRAAPASKQRPNPVRIEDLAWKEVDPTGLDDFEGFYGLEEIDDVRVDKDPTTGTVSFVPKQPASSGPSTKPKKTAGARVVDDDKDDEWEGFDDEQELTDPGVPNHFELLAAQDDGSSANVDVSAWTSLRLSSESLSSLARLGFSNPTPIQSAAIPLILAGENVIGKAPTGAGKTLAFGLPVLEKLQEPSPGSKRLTALIIEPTRELAHQIATHLLAMRSADCFSHLSVAVLTGGLSIQKQRRLLETADVVVATPGRLWEVVGDSADVLAKVKEVETLVIDEADRLLSQGRFQELEQVLSALDRREVDEAGESTEGPGASRQTLVFSATFARELQQKLAKQSKFYRNATASDSMAYLLNKLSFAAPPKFVDVNPTAPMAAKLQEAMLEVPAGTDKDLYLYATLLLHRPHPHTKSLVFVNSIAAVRRLVPFLKYLDIDALPLHSQMEQKARLRSIERFSATKTGLTSKSSGASASVLVATDVAARGLDIPAVHTVVHYHVPRTSDAYIHRSGRTARAEASGTSLLICAPQEAAGVRRLVAQVHTRKPGSKRRDLQAVEPEAKIISQLKPRAALAKQIADAEQAKEKKASADSWMAEAAEDLGIDLDDEDEEAQANTGRRGKNKGKKRKEREAEGRQVSKAELREAKASLRDMLAARVNTGVSARYLTSGNVDIDALLKQRDEQGMLGAGGFLGQVGSLLA